MKVIAPVIIVVAGALLSSCAPLLVGTLIGGTLVYEYQHQRWCQAPNGVVFRCHPSHFVRRR